MGGSSRELLILGTRGVPASHGGFETFAEQLALYLVARGWAVTVYCQDDDAKQNRRYEKQWNGISQVFLSSRLTGSAGSIVFDAKCILDCINRQGIILILGYNTAIFSIAIKALGRTIAINMDGLEWKRQKWSNAVRAWFYFNERVACWTATALVADHPAIAARLHSMVRPTKVTMIPYSSFGSSAPDSEPIRNMGLKLNEYWYSACRLEPENHILEIVQAFCRKKRDSVLVILGDLSENNAYHRRIKDAATESVRFVAPIYEREAICSFRTFARGYVHGHSVGGTNPSLVEALAAGNPVLAHDNEFNRWTAGGEQHFFKDVNQADLMFTELDANDGVRASCAKAARARFESNFRSEKIMGAYEELLSALANPPVKRRRERA